MILSSYKDKGSTEPTTVGSAPFVGGLLELLYYANICIVNDLLHINLTFYIKSVISLYGQAVI